MQIHLSDSRGRDAAVELVGVSPARRVRWVGPEGQAVRPVRVLRAVAGSDGPFTAAELLEGDPEIDLERAGRILRDTTRVWVGPDGVCAAEVWESVCGPDGVEKARRRYEPRPANIETEPLRWSGKLIGKAEAVRRYVFGGAMQLAHSDGLTFDFLRDIARYLDAAGALLVVGSGAKGNGPLILRHDGTQWRGFLEGRVAGESYLLLLHLSNMELKGGA